MKKKIQKAIVLIVVGVLVLSVMAMAMSKSYADKIAVSSGVGFSDVTSNNPFFYAISTLKNNDVVDGYNDGTFKPSVLVNRAEFLKILMGAKNVDVGGSNCFKDVADEWFSPYVCKAKELGYVGGYNDGSFKPSQNVNFSEASKMMVNVFGLSVDDSLNENWYQKYVIAMEKDNAIPASITSFSKTLTRGEMSDVVSRIDIGDTYELGNTYNGIKQGKEAVASLRKFDSCEDIGKYIEKNTAYDYYRYGDYFLDMPGSVNEGTDSGLMTPSEAAKSDDYAGSGAVSEDKAESFSTTNIQVEGVDEADIVKNDGQYIYLIKDATIRIVKAYPPTELKQVSEVTFSNESFYPSEMYVDHNQLVVIGSSYSAIPYLKSEYFMTDYGNQDVTSVYIFNITNKDKVVLDRTLVFEGTYNTSRKVGGTVYLVSNKTNYYWWGYEYVDGQNVLPLYSDSKTKVAEPVTSCGNVSYIPNSENSDYMVVAAIPLNSLSSKISTSVVMGYSGNVFSSPDNLYVTQRYYSPILWDSRTGEYGDESIIHKFKLTPTEVSYAGSGVVKGRTLNQFSMDEYDGYLRIATTAGSTWQNNSTNNLYVLDGNLSVIGKVEGLAKGEEIYSTRFIGKRAYMVTFKTVDPLFVIDLGNPASPKVLGELKVPGYSDYLHPYDENHLIGFGLTAVDMTDEEAAKFGGKFAWYQGVKLAMFDVSNVSNPIEMFSEVIGDRGTSSELQYNHKALLFDKEKGILAFPITVAKIDDSLKNDSSNSATTYGRTVFQGAYIYNVNLTDGFAFKGKLTHFDDFETQYHGSYEYMRFLDRILYMGNYYYTTSQYKVMANNMSDLSSAGEVVLDPGEGAGGTCDYCIQPLME